MRKVYKFVKENQEKFLVLIFLYLILSILASLPFFNIVIEPIFFLFFVILLATVVFGFDERFYVTIALLLLVFSFFSVLFGFNEIAELFGNLIFAFLLFSVLVGFITFLKRQNSTVR